MFSKIAQCLVKLCKCLGKSMILSYVNIESKINLTFYGQVKSGSRAWSKHRFSTNFCQRIDIESRKYAVFLVTYTKKRNSCKALYTYGFTFFDQVTATWKPKATIWKKKSQEKVKLSRTYD